MTARDSGERGGRRAPGIGAAPGAVPGYAALAAVAAAGAAFAHREGLGWLRLCGLALLAAALWRLVWHARARLTGSAALLRVGLPLAEARPLPWHHIRLITVDFRGPELLTLDGERLRLPAPRGHLTVSPRRFDAAVEALRAAVPTAEAARIAVSSPPAGRWTGRRLLARWAAVLLSVAVLGGWAVSRDEPWHAPWWPGSATLSALPDPCAVGEASVEPLALTWEEPRPTTDATDTYRVEGCGFVGEEARVELRYQLFPWHGSAGDRPRDAAAAAFYGGLPPGASAERIDGHDWRRAQDDAGVELFALDSNVIVSVTYWHGVLAEPSPAMETEVSRLASRALTALSD
ncbi:hypothetical protein RM844_26030 [Streptomyces sp. DSM 44915]|uniref:Uncharacterized protein n=1 Tax=Streptomyces chisholmiae TaxID=3075540 RepID=A0ABU2JXM4_9ACTN|nr:hypothetical protein [Streptomyces sp. DSM 44915]MDT0269748.1 hypothetical protein [Streptomyces sp. DSM 44915]